MYLIIQIYTEQQTKIRFSWERYFTLIFNLRTWRRGSLLLTICNIYIVGGEILVRAKPPKMFGEISSSPPSTKKKSHIFLKCNKFKWYCLYDFFMFRLMTMVFRKMFLLMMISVSKFCTIPSTLISFTRF